MARAATVPLVRTATPYAWLVDREERALAAGGTTPTAPSCSRRCDRRAEVAGQLRQLRG